MDRIEQFSTIAPDIGNIFRYISIVTAMPLLVALIYQEWDMILPMASVPIALVLLGTLLIQVPRREREAPLSIALMAVALIWLVCALTSALPFTLGLDVSYLDALFEAMSGWTDTGLTMMRSVDDLPRTLLFWRSLMQWLGGIGIVAFTIAMASRSGLTQFRLYRSEGRSEALMPSAVATGHEMWKIYLVLTILSVGLILLSGVPLWDSVNIALSAISTGGFSLHSEGIPFYNNPFWNPHRPGHDRRRSSFQNLLPPLPPQGCASLRRPAGTPPLHARRARDLRDCVGPCHAQRNRYTHRHPSGALHVGRCGHQHRISDRLPE